MSHSSTLVESQIDADTLGLLAVFQDNRVSPNVWKPMVEMVSMKNFNTQKTISMLLNEATYKAVKGGTEFEGGVVLGVREDYDDPAPSNTNDKSITVGDKCLAEWGVNRKCLSCFQKNIWLS